MQPDWIELCKLFSAHGVEFLVVGGQAVIAHGYPRLTRDLDLWVRPTQENGQRVLRALAEFGMPLNNVDVARFTDPKTMIVLGTEPFRVDVLTDIPGVDFDGSWMRRQTIVLEGEQLPLISKADLIANKRAVGRMQDLADVEALEAIEEDE